MVSPVLGTLDIVFDLEAVEKRILAGPDSDILEDLNEVSLPSPRVDLTRVCGRFSATSARPFEFVERAGILYRGHVSQLLASVGCLDGPADNLS